MNKPNNYEQTQAAGDYTPIELGGHYLVIKQVEERTSNKGKSMIVVSFDTADNDSQPHYFADMFRADIRPDKKWPSNGVSYIVTEDDAGNCSRNFKGFCTSVEKSNPGYKMQWGDGFAQSLKNKMIGGNFREELDVYNGKETRKHKLAWFISTDSVADAKVPSVYESDQHKSWVSSGGITTTPADANGFMNIPDGLEDELPFA